MTPLKLGIYGFDFKPPSFGSQDWQPRPFVPHKEKNKRKILKKLFPYPFFARPKNGYPQEKAPRRFASRLVAGFPRRAHDCGVVMNSHIRALRQHDDPAPLSCTRLGYQTMGLKTLKAKKLKC
jgi:hypothetical protein